MGAAAGLLRDPGSMRQLMSNPFIQSMLSTPDFMRSIIASNPALQALMESNPEVRRALEDPETLRTMTQAAQNPDLHREMMRNADRSLSNIEAMPGGHDALRRMYETVQAPLEAGMGGVGGGMADAGRAAAAPPSPPGAPLPNPWQQQPAAGGGSPFGAGFPSIFGNGGLGGFGAPDPAAQARLAEQAAALRARMSAMQANAAQMQAQFRAVQEARLAQVRQAAAAARAETEVTRSVLHAAIDAAMGGEEDTTGTGEPASGQCRCWCCLEHCQQTRITPHSSAPRSSDPHWLDRLTGSNSSSSSSSRGFFVQRSCGWGQRRADRCGTHPAPAPGSFVTPAAAAAPAIPAHRCCALPPAHHKGYFYPPSVCCAAASCPVWGRCRACCRCLLPLLLPPSVPLPFPPQPTIACMRVSRISPLTPSLAPVSAEPAAPAPAPAAAAATGAAAADPSAGVPGGGLDPAMLAAMMGGMGGLGGGGGAGGGGGEGGGALPRPPLPLASLSRLFSCRRRLPWRGDAAWLGGHVWGGRRRP